MNIRLYGPATAWLVGLALCLTNLTTASNAASDQEDAGAVPLPSTQRLAAAQSQIRLVAEPRPEEANTQEPRKLHGLSQAAGVLGTLASSHAKADEGDSPPRLL